MKVCSFYIDVQHAHTSTATNLVNSAHRIFQTEDISIWLNANLTPSPLGADALRAGIDKVISLYPDDPSVGSPYGTGNETFGRGPVYKRAASICMSSAFCAF